MIGSIEMVRQGRVRRAKLNYLRERKGKARASSAWRRIPRPVPSSSNE